jgi:deoxyribonuclease V
VAGIDNAYIKHPGETTAYAAAALFIMPITEPLEMLIVDRTVTFPYVPGLLSFREGPAAIAAVEQLSVAPDVILCDGQGYAHPRRFGLACHLGVVLDLPSVGCAKSRLIGEFEEPGEAIGDWTPLLDRGDLVGAAVRTQVGHAPLFVSPGHKVSVETAVAIALACCRDGRFLPVPTKAAHDAVTAHTKPLRGR